MTKSDGIFTAETDQSNVELWSAAGAAYARAEKEVRELVEVTGIPFLPTPMGKGVLSDDHPNCVAAARSRCAYVSNDLSKIISFGWTGMMPVFLFSRALLQADVIVLLGARLNWILHFGFPPRFSPHVKIIQVSYTLDT